MARPKTKQAEVTLQVTPSSQELKKLPNNEVKESKQGLELNCSVTINVHGTEVITLDYSLPIPYLLKPSNLHNAQKQFDDLFNLLVVNPTRAEVGNYIQKMLQEEFKDTEVPVKQQTKQQKPIALSVSDEFTELEPLTEENDSNGMPNDD